MKTGLELKWNLNSAKCLMYPIGFITNTGELLY